VASRDQAAANGGRNGNDTLADLEAQKNKEEAGRLHAMPPRIVRQCPGLHLFTRCSTVWMNQDIVHSTGLHRSWLTVLRRASSTTAVVKKGMQQNEVIASNFGGNYFALDI